MEVLDVAERIRVTGDPKDDESVISSHYEGLIEHDPYLCKGKKTCTYVFSIYNPSSDKSIRKCTFLVEEIILENIQEVKPGKAYINKINMGEYIYYRILDSEYNLEYISELRFDLESFSGDADLFISTSLFNERPSVNDYEY